MESDMSNPTTTGERFNEKWMPEPNSGCWLWTANTGSNSYGQIQITGKPVPAHRAAWELFKGPIPEGMKVCHRCDTPPCVNPDHLFLGTHAENIKDSYDKGRSRQDGEYNGAARLTTEQVEQIRSSTKSYREIADEFGIGKSQVGNIKKGLRWTK